MPLYESTFIARQDMSRQDVGKIAESLSGIVEQGGGKVIKNEYWGLKSLAYKINKNRKGHYTMLGIDAPAPAIKEMERNMRINEDIIRSLTVRVEEMDANPSVMLQQARSREEGYGSAAADSEAILDEAPAKEETAVEAEK